MAHRQLFHISSILFIIFLCSADAIRILPRSPPAVKQFDVNNYGAKGDGKTDDTQAFIKTWNQACSSTSDSVFLVPKSRTHLLKPITFTGPCKSALTVQISGHILASNDQMDYRENTRQWIVFKGVDNLTVEGDGGSIDGNGKIWWNNSCKIKKSNPCKHAPTALLFQECKFLTVRHLKIQNGQQMQLSFQRCNHVNATNLNVIAPEYSPNTDGIHITDSQNVEVTRTFIGTGDDCISIEDGSQTVRARNITCGPGHGISIGSLGDKDTPAHVSDIIVDGANLYQTTNGLRIKTYPGGSGIASHITFKNINLEDVANPIIINQKYCDLDKPCNKKLASRVQIRDVSYQNINGTYTSKAAVQFDCSPIYPCRNITMDNVHIRSINGGKSTQASCNNVQLSKVVDVWPRCQ